MRSDDNAGPSLLLAQHDIAHREHLHQHYQFHNKRQTATAQDSTVVEIVATISYVQVIDVDANGSTFAVQTILAAASTGGSGAALTEASSPTTTSAASPGTTNPPSAATSTVAGDLSVAGASLSLNSTTASASVKSIPTSFTSLNANSNATALISSGSSSKAFSNSTIPSSRPSLTYLTSTTLTLDESATSSISSFYTPSFSSSQASSASQGVILGGATGAGSGGASSSSTGAGNDNGSGSSPAPSTPVVVGGVVGGVAGAAIVIFLLMVLIRWKKRHGTMISLGSGDPGPGEDTTRALPPSGPSGPSGGMTERRSLAFAVPAALANLTGYKRSSQRTETDRTISSTAESERGFYRVSGRKLPSVLQSGGDGYGGRIGVDANTLSGSSFYRDSQGFYGGPGSPSFAPGAQPLQRDSAGGIPIMRPSPARTPVTEHGPFSAVPSPLTPPRRPDVLGRSHPSQDGSHASRFTEEV